MNRGHERHDGDPETDHRASAATRPSRVVLRRRSASDPGDVHDGDQIPTAAVPLVVLASDVVDDRIQFLEMSRKHRVDAAATATAMGATVVPMAPG
jgi:hypothetical protein